MKCRSRTKISSCDQETEKKEKGERTDHRRLALNKQILAYKALAQPRTLAIGIMLLTRKLSLTQSMTHEEAEIPRPKDVQFKIESPKNTYEEAIGRTHCNWNLR